MNVEHVAAIAGIVTLEGIALIMGRDGTTLAASIAILAAILGVAVGRERCYGRP
jgi:hypothetical protein